MWIELAKLYRSINDFDSIKGIFSKNFNLTTEYTKQGLIHEANNDFYQARKCYIDALNQEWPEGDEVEEADDAMRGVSKVEEELWEQLMLRCCSELNDWKTMSDWTTEDASLHTLFTRDSYALENLFPYAFKSKIKLILEGEHKKHEDVFKFIQNLDSDGKKYLEQSFSVEMALINLQQKDFNAAKYYTYLAIQKYLMDWSSINKTIIQGRLAKLHSLQCIVELNEFLKFADSNQAYSRDLDKKVESLLDLWRGSMPNVNSDPASTWDDVVNNRCVYLQLIEQKFYSDEATRTKSLEVSVYEMGENDEEEASRKRRVVKRMEKCKWSMRIEFARAAHLQGNFKLALNKLQQTKAINRSAEFGELQAKWMHCYLQTHLARAKFVANELDESLGVFFNALCLKEILKFDKNVLHMKREFLLEQQILHASFAKFLIDSFVSVESARKVDFTARLMNDEKKRTQLMDYLTTSHISDMDEIVEGLLNRGVDSLKKVGDDLKGSLELSSYCDYFLRRVENEENCSKSFAKVAAIKETYPAIIVRHLLRAIRQGSYEARRRFPRLLQIVEVYPENTLDNFIETSEKIPCWMFLSWVSQMTAILDKPESKGVRHLIEKICNEYPQAIVYPFKMSLDGFKFDYQNQAEAEFVAKIASRLNQVPLVNQFIAALHQLTSPDLLFKDYVAEICGKIKNRDSLLKLFHELYVSLIEESVAVGSESLGEWGNIRKSFARHLKVDFEQEFGQNGKKVTGLSENEIKQKLTRLNTVVNEYSKKGLNGNLSDFSPWLKKFKRNLAKDLEIPGQYSGKTKPMPEYHVKIESFDERVLALASLRRPKCITIRGNDQKEHRFLVKGGEDQRQDQRIETLFELINDFLKSDPRCYQRNLHIKTYQVIPMTAKLALIEWLPDTKTLKEAILSARNDEELKKWESRDPDFTYQKYINDVLLGIEKSKCGFSLNEIYGFVYAKFKRELVAKSFREVENLVPWDLLRRFIRSMSASSEAYFVLRNQFVTSYSVASASQYILGIGDRHLSNWMLDLRSGRAIGIDFGMAFGHAAVNLQVPELMPIRLSRQILNLTAPLKQHGLFEACMTHTLRAMRENNDLLMCILDVFIKEPSIDWIGSAARIGKQNLNEEAQYSAGVEYAKSRVNSAKNKLNGINPCVITRDDLLSGIHKDSKFLKYFLDVLLGRAEHCSGTKLVLERARLLREKGENYKLTVEEQVKCIIEQSTDPDILGRTWCGWQPYI